MYTITLKIYIKPFQEDSHTKLMLFRGIINSNEDDKEHKTVRFKLKYIK